MKRRKAVVDHAEVLGVKYANMLLLLKYLDLSVHKDNIVLSPTIWTYPLGKLPSLIKQIVWTILGEESLFGSMNLTLPSLMDLMSVRWHFFDVFSYFTFFDSLHFERFDPLYLLQHINFYHNSARPNYFTIYPYCCYYRYHYCYYYYCCRYYHYYYLY